MTIILNGKRFAQVAYQTEKEFEDEIVRSSKTLFGAATIYVDAKKRLESKTLGTTVPDGFYFDFRDPSDPQFYIVEVELSQHSFHSVDLPRIRGHGVKQYLGEVGNDNGRHEEEIHQGVQARCYSAVGVRDKAGARD